MKIINQTLERIKIKIFRTNSNLKAVNLYKLNKVIFNKNFFQISNMHKIIKFNSLK